MKVKPQTNKSSTAMGKLLAAHKNSFITLQKGQLIKGKIIKLSSSEVLVDIGAKSSALVLEREKPILNSILATFKIGESVEVSVLTPESETGQPVVSLRRFMANIAWKKLDSVLEKHEFVDVKVQEITKSGFVVSGPFGVSGFLPQSHISQSGTKSVSVGETISAMVYELNRKDNKVIFSQKPIISDDDYKKMISQFKLDQKLSVNVNNVAPFGLFVNLPLTEGQGSIEGFIHISEIAWDKTEDLASKFTPGQTIDAVITKFDKEERKVQLSIKRLTKDPFEEIMTEYPVDKKVSGKILKIEEGGIAVDLGDGIEGYLRKEKIPPTVEYKEGQELTVTISEYDKRHKKIFVLPVLLKKSIGYR